MKTVPSVTMVDQYARELAGLLDHDDLINLVLCRLETWTTVCWSERRVHDEYQYREATMPTQALIKTAVKLITEHAGVNRRVRAKDRIKMQPFFRGKR